MDPQNNLLVRLHKWASRQDENFLTETFAFLLQYLIEEEPQAAAGLLRSLTDGFLELQPGEARAVAVRTQIVTGEGTPDLSLRTLDKLAFVEVKSESPVSAPQLDKYRRLLRESGVPSTRLVLLTRHVIDLDPAALEAVLCIRWYQVADWVEVERGRYTFKAVSAFLVQQFLGLLGTKGMTMSQVTWELSGGVRALRNFMNMLEEAAHVAGVKVQAKANTRHSGVSLDGGKYWVGINFDDPDRLIFQTEYQAVDPSAAEKLGTGYVYEWSDKKGHGWGQELDLTAEHVHFYARPRASQMQLLESFIRESMDLARRVAVSVNPSPKLDTPSSDEG
ncbi:MAG: hypothetical protein J2P46_07400 [Zavarzinella sp.]|nr:hypothetical protein [Zavarzinella sp.]